MAEEIVGVIYSKEEADRNYGAVLSSVEISSSELAGLCSQAAYYLMFNLTGGILSILKEERILLYPGGFNVGENEVYAVYSKSKILELINTGKASTTVIERRNNFITVSNENHTLETGAWCPPFCKPD